MVPRPKIFVDGKVLVSLANDTVTTLVRYVLMLVDVEGVQAVIKAWVIDVEVYDLLLRVNLMRRIQCTQHLGDGKIITKGYVRKYEVLAQIVHIEIHLPVVEFDDVDGDFSADKACQKLIGDDPGKEPF